MINDIIKGLKYIKINGQTIFEKDQFCKLKGEDTSCQKSVADSLELKQGDDIYAECIYSRKR